ncbi:MAG: efflux RND transporter periplasmic adaptor subunit [Planctomycetaceae bacterium]|nr:efflux RND transporter periplasmic adaptor subunit [Planctomycetaceae bacterium]
MSIVKTNSHLAAALVCLAMLQGCQKQQQAAPPPPVPEVGIVTVTPQEVVLTTDLPGRTASFRVAEVRPQVNGIVQKRLFTEGSDVKAGDVLYEIDAATFKAAQENAAANLEVAVKGVAKAQAALAACVAGVTREKATLDQAQVDLKRTEQLFATRTATASELDDAKTKVNVAKANLEAADAQVESSRQTIAGAQASVQQAQAALATANINLAYTKITAPLSGRIGKSTVNDGALVTAYQPLALATIQQLDPIYVDVPQSTAELLRLRQRLKDGSLNHNGAGGEKVKLSMEDGSPCPLEGTLQFRDVTVDPTTGSVILRAVFPNPNATLLPGMFVRASIVEGVNRKAILIPQQAVTRDPRGTPMAMIVDADGKAAARVLTLDRAIGSQWFVSAGLVEGEKLIVEGGQKVRPGSLVKHTPMKLAQAPRATPGSK